MEEEAVQGQEQGRGLAHGDHDVRDGSGGGPRRAWPRRVVSHCRRRQLVEGSPCQHSRSPPRQTEREPVHLEGKVMGEQRERSLYWAIMHVFFKREEDAFVLSSNRGKTPRVSCMHDSDFLFKRVFENLWCMSQ